MTRYILTLAAVLILATGAQAQDAPTRYQQQHFKRTLTMLIKNLESATPEIQVTSVQTIREMQMEFPGESFEQTLKPLSNLLKNEGGETTLRVLAALAIDALHTDDGDAAILSLNDGTSNKSVQDLCRALSVKSSR